MNLSILIPHLSSRAHWLDALEESLDVTAPDAERIIVLDFPNWGEAINEAADAATGDYLLMASDDHTYPFPGWAEAAAKVCDAGHLPAPMMFNRDGSIQSCGDYYGDKDTAAIVEARGGCLPEGTPVEFPRVPFVSRAQWDLLGPMLPIHFSDVYLGTNAKEVHGIDTVVTYGYKLVHHFAQEGRLSYDSQEKIRLATEAAQG